MPVFFVLSSGVEQASYFARFVSLKNLFIFYKFCQHKANCYSEKNMDESADGVRCDQAEEPENN